MIHYATFRVGSLTFEQSNFLLQARKFSFPPGRVGTQPGISFFIRFMIRLDPCESGVRMFFISICNNPVRKVLIPKFPIGDKRTNLGVGDLRLPLF